MSPNVPGFQSFFSFLHNFVLAKLASSSIRVKEEYCCNMDVHACVCIIGFIIHNSVHNSVCMKLPYVTP